MVCAALGSPGNGFWGLGKSEIGARCAKRGWLVPGRAPARPVQQGHGGPWKGSPPPPSRRPLRSGQLAGPPRALGPALAGGRRAGPGRAVPLAPGQSAERRAGAGGRPAGRGRRRSSPGEGGPGLGAGGGRAGGLCARRRPRAVADLEGFTPALPPSAPRAPARLPARACALSARTPLIFSSRRELTRSPCLAAGAQGAAAAWLMRCLLGRWCFTPLRLLVRRWLISESSCCPALVWTLRAWWSSLVVSVPGWRGGVIIGLCETRALRFGAVCQRSKQHGIFPRSHGSKGVPC